jgi:hypothetical protein
VTIAVLPRRDWAMVAWLRGELGLVFCNLRLGWGWADCVYEGMFEGILGYLTNGVPPAI